MLKRPTDEVLPAMHFCPAMGEVYLLPALKGFLPARNESKRDTRDTREREGVGCGKWVSAKKLVFYEKRVSATPCFFSYRHRL